MVQVKAQHRTEKKPNGQPLIMTFEQSIWQNKWLPTGKWLFIETIGETAEQSRGIEETAVTARGIEPPKALKTTVKKGCGCNK